MIGELWSWCSKQRCSKQRQASQVFVPLHGPAIGCGLPSWRSSALVGATSFNKGQLLGDLSYFISGSNAPGNCRKWVEGPGSVGAQRSIRQSQRTCKACFTRSNSFSPHSSPMRRYYCYSYFTGGEPEAMASDKQLSQSYRSSMNKK